MKILKGFKEYQPAEPPVAGMRYLTCDSGEDWYEVQKQFSDSTLKIVFDSAGTVVSMSTDVSRLWPEHYSVAEVKGTDMPEGLDISGGWVFDGKKVQTRVYSVEENISQATKTVSDLMATANASIAPLQDAVDFDEATEGEQATLTAWKKYRIALNRLDLSAAPDIHWPEVPTHVA
ncbi:tail fiber assembly protein [Rahnella inusitata]|uniref:tail fiber assembly protein n=1 Tax=Rahnella inusitata TaxID=58169 RepID=UPI0039B0E50E